MSDDTKNRLKTEFADRETRHIYTQDWMYCNIASQLAIIRRQRGWTQKQLADKAGMAQERISVMEDVNYRRWNLSTLARLAEALDVALDVRFVSFDTAIENIAAFSEEGLKVDSY